MSLGSSRIIAAQAVVVGVLMVVVFLTLLRPDAENQLFAIETPGETEIAQQPDRQFREQAENRDRGDRRDSRRVARDRRPARVLGAGAGVISATPGSAQPLPATGDGLAPGTPGGAEPPGGAGNPGGGNPPGGGGPPGGSDDEGPADDQYADSVARLTAKLY